jgi:TRAP-type C4-dicarboxylate transport system substrate-binding protein
MTHARVMRLHQMFCAFASISLLAGPAYAEEVVLRMSTSAPDGTTWAHELKAFAREVETGTEGHVKVKWYWGGIAGDEVQQMKRIERGQLDGSASGGVLCQDASPSMRVVGIHGVFNGREEASFVLNRLRPRLEEEFRASGYVYVAATGLGPDMMFSKVPIKTFDDLRKLKVWHWDIDQRGMQLDTEIGLHDVLLSLESLAAGMEDGRIDSFITNPASLVAFQWVHLPKFVLYLPMGYSWGCLVMSTRAFEKISLEHQQVIRAAGAATGVRLDEQGRKMDEAMFNGVLQKLGIKVLPASDALRAEFLALARGARDKLGDQLVPAAALQQVLALLADYRSEHTGTH